MQKILVDDAYKKVFYDWVYDNVVGLEVEFASRPPSAKGFVPVKWRWVNERTFAWFGFFRRHAKDYEKQLGGTPQILPKYGYYLPIAK